MAIGLLHDEWKNNTAKGFRDMVIRLDHIVGNSTWRSTATDATTLKNLMRNQASPSNAAIHETDQAGFEIAVRRVDEMVRLGILDSTDIAAMNDLATSREVFIDEDQTLSAMR